MQPAGATRVPATPPRRRRSRCTECRQGKGSPRQRMLATRADAVHGAHAGSGVQASGRRSGAAGGGCVVHEVALPIATGTQVLHKSRPSADQPVRRQRAVRGTWLRNENGATRESFGALSLRFAERGTACATVDPERSASPLRSEDRRDDGCIVFCTTPSSVNQVEGKAILIRDLICDAKAGCFKCGTGTVGSQKVGTPAA